MTHNYVVETDSDGYITSFYVPVEETGNEYTFDGSELELEFLNAYKIQNRVPVLDQAKKEEIIAEREAEAQRPTQLDIVEAQVTYTALMTDTLLEEE
ncbi:MAG: hypothetical protein IJF87_08775 [Erysipelotrichaceae bacterium]|nr:hypothetical protein [Erysipelotrichaceae bacterium]